MKVAVIGSRHFMNYLMVKDYLDRLNQMRRITAIVSGGASGADSLGERWADSNGVDKIIYEAEWDNLTYPDAIIRTNPRGKQYDAKAGMRRNILIIDNCDVVLAFWDMHSPGTRSAVQQAKKIHRPIKVIKIPATVTRAQWNLQNS